MDREKGKIFKSFFGGSVSHKHFITYLILFLLLPMGRTLASFSGPFILYTLEEIDPGDYSIDQVPDNLYLAPQIKNGDLGEGPQIIFPILLKELGSLKPERYKGTVISGPLPEFFPVKSITFKTAVKTKWDFKVLMSEIICTFDHFAFDNKDMVFRFHFTDPGLEKSYGGKEFIMKDVPFPAFLLNSHSGKKKTKE